MNTTVEDEVSCYVDAVRAALGDLPVAEREAMVDGLAEHLAEVVADGEGLLADRLGPPEEYAAELRGMAVPLVGDFPPPPEERRPRRRHAWKARLHGGNKRLGALLGYDLFTDFLTLLRPAWWVLRGYLATMLIASLLNDSGSPIGLLPRLSGNILLALLFLAAGVVVSVWFGRSNPTLSRWPRRGLRLASAVLAVVAVAGFFDADDSARTGGDYYSNVGYTDRYSNVEDVFVYDQQGNLVPGARLLDQRGQVIELGNAYCFDNGSYETQNITAGVYPYCPEKAPFVPEPVQTTTAPTAE